MVIPAFPPNQRRRGALMVDLAIAIVILTFALLPLAYSIAHEARAARGYYLRAIAVEIVDGEMETLLAGEWRSLTPGEHSYPVNARAAANLPPGQFTVSRSGNHLRLVWRPDLKHHGGVVVREVTVP